MFSLMHSVGVNIPTNLSGALWGKEDLTDIVFVVDGERIPAHKLVLASQSEYFRVMLYGEMKEASQEEIVLSDVPLAPFKKLLQYAYTGVLQLDEPLEVSYEHKCLNGGLNIHSYA